MTTNNHPAHGPVSLERLHQISEILSKASAQSDGGNLGYAMADAVKVINGAIAAFGAEPVFYAAEETLAYAKAGELHLKCLDQPMGDAVIPLYTYQPATVVPDEYKHLRELYHAQEKRLFKIAQRIKGPSFDKYAHSPSQAIDVLEAEIFGKNGDNVSVCRAAMLQAGNSPVTPDDVRRMDWLVSKTVNVREPMVYGSHSLFWSQTITDEEDDYHATKLREQIDEAMAAERAAAPQQEDL